MDKENFIFRPSLDPLKSVSISDTIRSLNEKLENERKLAEDKERLIKQFKEYKERNKAE